MRRGFKTSAENLAVEQRLQLGLRPHDHLPAQDLAEHLGVILVGLDEIPGLDKKYLHHLTKVDPTSFSAATIYPNDQTTIIYNPSHTARRFESNLMHELAHIILGHRTIRIGKVFQFALDLREFKSEDEEEAEWLGGCLQIPREGLTWAISRGMTNKQVAEYFHASEEMVRFRRNMTGIDRQFKRRPHY